MAREADRVVERLARAHALLTSADPLPRDHLVGVTQDRLFAQGTATPAVHSQFSPTSSGLFVPSSAARPAEPIDQIQVYLTAPEVLGVSVSRDEVINQLAQVSLEIAIPWIAGWLSRLHAPLARQGDVDSSYLDTEVGPALAQKVRNLLRDPKTVLLAPQTLTCLLKLALLICPSKGVPTGLDGHDGHLPMAQLGLAEHLSSDLVEFAEGEFVIDGVPGPLGREMMANQLGNSRRQEAGRWAAFTRVWKELPVELDGHPRVVNLEKAYQDATGVPLDDLVSVCAALWATASKGTPHMGPDYFDSLGWGEQRLAAALALVATTPENLARDVYEEMKTHGFRWSRRALELHPVIAWPSGHLTVVDPEMILARAVGEWPLLDIRRTLATEGRRGAAQTKRVDTAYQYVMEAYSIEIARSITEGGRSGRVYDDDDLKRAYGQAGSVADMAIDYGHAWVVVEATTRGVQARTIAGVSDEAATQDIDRFVDKCRQIDATVTHLRRNEHKLVGGVPSAVVRRFRPVLLVANPVSIDPVFMTLLRDALAKARVLQGPDIAPLEVMELEDLDVVEALVEDGGPSLDGVLAAKEYSPMWRTSVRDYILLGLGRRDLPRPARVQQGWRGWLNTAMQTWAQAA